MIIGEERLIKIFKILYKGNNFWNGLLDNRLFILNILIKVFRIILFVVVKYYVKNVFSNLIFWIKIKYFVGFFIYILVYWLYSLF